MSTLSGAGLFSGISSGLTGTISLMANAYPGGLTLSNIADARTNPKLANYLNPTFASYIQTNFSSLDSDKDGMLGPKDLSTLTNKIMAQGLTAAQLTQLGAATGLAGTALEQVLAHFNDIDANHDGKVTMAEISAYNVTSASEKKKTEFMNKAAANQSVFYGDENASSAANSSSLLSFKYLDDNNSVS